MGVTSIARLLSRALVLSIYVLIYLLWKFGPVTCTRRQTFRPVTHAARHAADANMGASARHRPRRPHGRLDGPASAWSAAQRDGVA